MTDETKAPWARQYGLELDRCECGRAIPGDLDQCPDCEWLNAEWPVAS